MRILPIALLLSLHSLALYCQNTVLIVNNVRLNISPRYSLEDSSLTVQVLIKNNRNREIYLPQIDTKNSCAFIFVLDRFELGIGLNHPGTCQMWAGPEFIELLPGDSISYTFDIQYASFVAKTYPFAVTFDYLTEKNIKKVKRDNEEYFNYTTYLYYQGSLNIKD